MRTWIQLAAILGSVLLPVSSFAQKVSVDFDSKAPFATYKTYAWTTGTPSPNPLGEQRIRDGVDQRMAAKGLKKVDSNPDVVVATHAVAQEQKELNAYGFGGGPRWGGTGTARVDTYVQGTLVVDLYDAGTKQLVWRGVGTDTASDKPEKNTQKLNKVLDKMFKDYPPKAK